MVFRKGGSIMKGIDFSKLPKDPETSHKIIDATIEENKLDKELGRLGKFFGSGESVRLNITGLLIIILILTGILYTITILCFNLSNNTYAISISNFWSIITPIITLALGYLFGKK